MTTIQNEFQPDYIISPGEILEEVLEAQNFKKNEFAERCGRSPKAISQILNGKAPVTPELAIRFQRILGSSSTLWNNLEANYRLQLALKKEQEELKKQIIWAKDFPVNELAKWGFFEKPRHDIESVTRILDFFSVGSVESWEQRYQRVSLNFRHSPSFKSDSKTLVTWIRIGTIKAAQIDTVTYNPEKFRSILNEIRKVTKEEPKIFEPVIKEKCREAGVVVIFFPEFKKMSLSGITRWLSKDKALIMMSLRHKSDDHFWFTFFHEAAHVLLHRKHSKKKIFIDDIRINNQEDELETAANSFSANFLIPRVDYNGFLRNGDFSKNSILSFAQNIGIAPGIVVGRLQRERKIGYYMHNDLKQRFRFKEK